MQRRFSMQYKLKVLRINRDLTLEDMARLLHVGKSTVSRWERGEISIPMNAFKEYCLICDVDAETIKEMQNNICIRKEN